MSGYTMRVGDVEILALSDMSLPFSMPLTQLFPTTTPELWAPYRELYPNAFEQDHMLIEIGCYLLRSAGQVILVDTGYGQGPIEAIGGRMGEMLDSLADNGIEPEEVDVVFLSHLHSDHVGWNVLDVEDRLEATFMNARYLVHQADLEHFRKPEVQAAASFPFMDRCVETIVRLGMLDTLDDDTDLTNEVRAIYTPGHTPGHMSILVTSRGEEAMIQGDVLVHPAQVTEEEWNCHFDHDWAMATETRKKLLDEVEEAETPLISCHFPAPGVGRIVRRGGRRYWQPGLGR